MSISTVKNNFLSLTFIQVANYIFPLLTIPYVTRIFGPELFGLYNLAVSIITYFLLIVNYGFDLSASRDIAQKRDDKEKIQQIFNNVLFAKLFLFIISLLIFLISILVVNKIRENYLLFTILFISNLLLIFFPTWYFQGVEKLKLTSILNFILKLIFTLLIFYFIKTKDDFLFYPASTIIAQLLISAASIYIIIKKLDIRVQLPSFKEIINTLKSSSKIFMTTVVINLYTTTNIVILGFLSNEYNVGIYSAALNIIRIVATLMILPFSQSVYPNIGYSFSKSYEEGINKIYKGLIFVIPFTLIPSIILFIFPDLFIKVIFGSQFNASITTLRILSFLPVIICLSNMFGIQGLLNLKKDNYVYLVTMIGAVVGLSLNFILVPVYQYNGSAISWLITEVIITTLMFYAFVKSTEFKSDVKRFYYLTLAKNKI